MTSPASLIAALIGEAQQRGFVGTAPIDHAVAHARGFAEALDVAPSSFVDLGSGGGLLGLVLAELWPAVAAVLVDANRKRCVFLRNAVTRLGLDARVTVVEERAEVVGRDPEHRGRHPLVVARSFGAPAVTAECAAPLLKVSGRLVVSEPPEDGSDRWPVEGLELVGLRQDRTYRSPFHYRVMVQDEPCPERYPRRVGIPAKRPLF